MGIFLTVMAMTSGLAFVWAPQGRLWNARLLPFWFLCLYLLAGVAVAEVGPRRRHPFLTSPSPRGRRPVASPPRTRSSPLASPWSSSAYLCARYPAAE